MARGRVAKEKQAISISFKNPLCDEVANTLHTLMHNLASVANGGASFED